MILKYLLFVAAIYIIYIFTLGKVENFDVLKLDFNNRHWWQSNTFNLNKDATLYDLQRKLHNIEAVTRVDVFPDPIHAHPGGGDGSDKRFWVAEQLELERSSIQKKIRDIISSRRKPWSDAYPDNLPTTSLGGDFYDCHFGDCQWDMDYDEHILGIPSTVGTRHVYY